MTNDYGFLVNLVAYSLVGGTITIIYWLVQKYGKKNHKRERLPYLKKDYLLSRAEKEFYFLLREILQDRYLLFAQVRLSDLLRLPRGLKDWRHHWNRIQQKHVDFAVCDKANIAPLLAIELDDSSHRYNHRVKRDSFVDKAFQDAGLPILHVKTSYRYDKEALASKLFSLIEKPQIT